MKRDWFALILAMVFPTIMAWTYFVVLANPAEKGEHAAVPGTKAAANPLIQAAYTAGKVIQFAFPLLWVWSSERWFPRPAAPTRPGLAYGMVSGLLVAVVMLVAYVAVLRESRLLGNTPTQVQQKIAEFGLDMPAAYILFAVFLSVVHSFLEEYYWRWFVFGRLRNLVPVWIAMLLSSLAFMSHHVIILAMFFPGKLLEVVVPFSLGVAAGGAFWAWLYQRTNSIYAPWLSHMLIDITVMAVGYVLAFGSP